MKQEQGKDGEEAGAEVLGEFDVGDCGKLPVEEFLEVMSTLEMEVEVGLAWFGCNGQAFILEMVGLASASCCREPEYKIFDTKDALCLGRVLEENIQAGEYRLQEEPCRNVCMPVRVLT